MSDSDKIISSDERDISSSSEDASDAGAASLLRKDLTIEDSDEDSANESVMVRRRPNAMKKVAVLYSDQDDSDEEEEKLERRALSPSTRMSITGVRPADLSDSNDSEIEYSEEVQENTAQKSSLINLETSTKDLTIEDSDDSANESVVVRRRPNAMKKVAVLYSDQDDSDEEEEKLERRALSPSTRMSITGVRPADLSDSDDSEIEYSEEVQENTAQKSSLINLETSTNSLESHEGSSAEYGSAENESSIEEKPVTPKMRPLIQNVKESSFSQPRYSTQFETDISEQLSSTIFQSQEQADESKTNSCSDSDIEVISCKEQTIEISSSDEANKENAVVSLQSKTLTSSSSRKQSASNFVQPKISAILSSTRALRSTAPAKTPRKSVHVLYVSQEFYNKELQKLTALKAELLNAQRLLEKISKSLPDGGLQLSLRVDGLRADVKKKEEYLETLKIDDGSQLLAQQQKQPQPKPFIHTDAPDWNELSKAVNQIQPTHTGKQGLATFNNQKALTVERLKDLHGSLENRPSEDVFADDPQGLKVTLMDHQKHALAWMGWREKQRPHGGILADDMGLGKTLTMIALMLAAKNREEDEDDGHQSESEDEETKRNHGWSSKTRRNFYPGGTLVVCPASLIRQWESEVNSKLSRHKLTVCVHHGNNRDTKPKHLRTYDMVVTTYNIVAREHKAQGALFGMKWRRIVLDEAHVVRNHKSQSSEGVCGLRGKYRWALTGTPIQNKEMDIYALLKFLRCTPFDDLAHWKRWIDKSAGGHERLNTVMKTLMLRRTKVQLQQRGELQCLPEKRIDFIEVQLDKDEMNVYQKIMVYSRTLFAQFLYQRAERNTDLMYSAEAKRPTFLQSKVPNGAYLKIHEKFTRLHQGEKEIKSHEILVLLLRLRQICCHPGLVDAMLEDDDAAASDSDKDQGEIDLLAQLNKLAITDTSTGSNNSSGSDVLRPDEEVMTKASARVLHRSNPVFDLRRPSSKMLKVLDTLKRQASSSNDKAIVVSQWTSVLNILKTHLEEAGVVTLSLNGTIPVKNRQAIVSEFNDANSNKRVLLLSLTAGGVGLNLVGANHLLLIDLHWNPQLEAQAQDRIYRMGQKKNVVIYKFMCKDTVEERIRALQEHKIAIANGVLTGAKVAEGSKLTMDDLKGLFGM